MKNVRIWWGNKTRAIEAEMTEEINKPGTKIIHIGLAMESGYDSDHSYSTPALVVLLVTEAEDNTEAAA